jgi:uncharacterized protein DUF1259
MLLLGGTPMLGISVRSNPCRSAVAFGQTVVLAGAILVAQASLGWAQNAPGAAWDSVGRVLKASPTPTGGYVRYNFPRRDIALKVGDVTVSPALALGTWAGFSGDAADATMMGDLVLLDSELKPVLAELARQRLNVTAIHNHLVGEAPRVTYVHYHGEGNAGDLAHRLDLVLARTATPRPVTSSPPPPVTIDTALVFNTLGIRGRGQGNVAQLTVVLVSGDVIMHGKVVNPAMGYGTPINIQMVDANRAVATGDFTVLATKAGSVVRALSENGITATAMHSHLVDEQPQIRYIHFWADGPLADVLRGLRAALDAGR